MKHNRCANADQNAHPTCPDICTEIYAELGSFQCTIAHVDPQWPEISVDIIVGHS